MTDYTDPVYVQRVLGISKIAASLRSAGFEVLCLNHLSSFSVDEIKTILKQCVSDQTVFVGVNSFFYRVPQLISKGGTLEYKLRELGSFLPHGHRYNSEIKQLIKDINPDCKLVLGGPDAKDRSYIKDYDVVILGYADDAVVNFALDRPAKKSWRSVFGPTVIDDQLAEDYDFVNTPMYFHDHDVVVPGETLSTEIARGCIFKCKFCTYPLNGKKKNDFIKLESVLLSEFLHNYEKFNVTRYLLSDDTFNDSVDKVAMLHRVSQQLPFQLEFWAYLRLDLLAAHPESIDLLIQSGCRGLFFGIETLNERTASYIGKGGSRQKLVDTINYIKNKYGTQVTVHASFIFGLPYESKQSLELTANQLINGELPIDSFDVFPLMIKQGRDLDTSAIDTNYAELGYQLQDPLDAVGMFYSWQSDSNSYQECKALADHTLETALTRGHRKISGQRAFMLAGTGLELDAVINQPASNAPWGHYIRYRKNFIQRYKEILYSLLPDRFGQID